MSFCTQAAPGLESSLANMGYVDGAIKALLGYMARAWQKLASRISSNPDHSQSWDSVHHSPVHSAVRHMNTSNGQQWQCCKAGTSRQHHNGTPVGWTRRVDGCSTFSMHTRSLGAEGAQHARCEAPKDVSTTDSCYAKHGHQSQGLICK